MKILSSVALMVLCAGLFAANGVKNVNGTTFVEQNGVWIQEGVTVGQATKDLSVVHNSKRWQKWHAQGESLQDILDLGPNVIFSFTTRDGEKRVFSVFANKGRLDGAVSSTTTTSLLGNALLSGAAVARGEGGGGGEGSPSTP